MDYTPNAKMMLGYIDDDDDDILDYDGNLDLSTDNEDEDEAETEIGFPQQYPETPDEKIHWQEQIRMIHLRSHLNQLMEKVRHAQYVTDKTREELKKCRGQIQQYEGERDRLFMEITTKESEGNQSAVYRIRAAHERICKELEAEQKLERMIIERLDHAEYELALAEVERGKFILAEDDLLQREHQLAKEKTDMAMVRLHKEEQLARQALITKRKDDRTRRDVRADEERRHIQAVEDAERSHERANKYLNRTLAKLRQRQDQEAERYKTDMTNKMDMLLKLKNDIAHNRENLRAIRARDKASENQKKSAEQAERESIAAEGGNPEEILLIKKRKNEMEKKKHHFEAQQKEKKAVIMQKILREEENIKKRRQQQPYLFDCPEREKSLRVAPLKKKPLKALENYMAATADEAEDVDNGAVDNKDREILEKLDQAEEERAMAEGGEGEDEFEREISLPVEERESDVSDVEDEGEVPVCLAKPEFEGLWNKETKPYRVPKDTDHLVSKPVGGSKMDKEILQKTLDKTRDGIVVTQVAAGREFTGCPFYSKPDVIHFKDFVVGKTYKKKVTLTNVSYTVNYIKYLDITEKLKDFIKIQFDPPGQMSAGLTCDMTVTFKPMINEDLKGQVNFLTQTGPFYIPLICSTKKCDLSLDVGCIDFGTTVIGETMKRSFTLTNHGALGTKFDFFKVTGMKPRTLTTAGTSLGRLDEPFSDAGLASKTQWKGLADRSGSIDSDSKWPSVCESKRPSTNDKTPSRRPSERYSDVNTPIERDVVSLQEGGAEEGAKQWLSQHNTPVAEVLPENDTRTDKDQTPKGGTSTFQSGQETPAAKDLTTDSMQAVSPDSAEAQEKSKQTGGSTSNVVDSKKKSEEALDKIPEARETTAPADGTGEVSVVESSEAADGNMGEVMAEGSDQKQDQDSDEATSPDLAVSEMEDYGSLDGMRVGPLVTGEIGPFSSLRLEIIWQPTIPGKVDSEFLVSFADPLSEQLTIHALANAIDVPVWVERQTVDLKICMFDRLYQDTITVNNRATTALRLKFEVCKELRNHLELLPKTGYIQAQSQFSAQLKFLPRQSLFEEAAKFFDPETGVLEAPMTIRVADQTTPVDFTVQAVVTNSDLEFDVSDIDFGYCTIHESVKKTIKLTNNSILPQQFGFVGLPEYVEVQPNDGFGTLLPLETVELDVIFSPRKTKEHKLDLVCRSLINRDFKISCKGVGVLTPLELSQQVIHFAATPLYDIASCAFHVVNSHTSSNEFTHPVPRIGKGEICPVGPTSFEFMVPKDAPITISPSVGTVEAGKKCRVQVRFTPTLNDYEIRQEALRIHTKMEAAKEEKERQEAALKEKQEKESNAAQAGKGKGKGKSSPKGPQSKTSKLSAAPSSTGSAITQETTPRFDPDKISRDSPEYQAAVTSLVRQFKGQFKTLTVPCYVASGATGNPGELSYSIHNTLYLEVHCPAIKPPVVVISDGGRRTVDFGDVSIGQTCPRSVTIQNISEKDLDLQATVTNPSGPFLMLNALRALSPGATHTILLTFSPLQGQVFQEELGIKTLNSTLHLTLKGHGVSPMVNLSVENEVFDMNSVLVGEFIEKTFKMENTSTLAIDFVIKQDSLSPLRHSKAQSIPPFLTSKESQKSKNYVGTQNANGKNVFDIVPTTGTIQAGESKEIMVTFAPDHASDLYSDGIRIELFDQEESHFFQLIGQAKPRVMFLDGTDPLLPSLESLALQPSAPEEDDSGVEHKIKKKPIGAESMSPPTLVTIKSVMKDDTFQPGVREIYAGCVRTMAVSQKKPGKSNGEFVIEGLQGLIQKGFTVEPQKGMVEAGTKKPIVFTWTPPQGYDPSNTMEETATLTLRCDVTEQITLMIRAMVVSE